MNCSKICPWLALITALTLNAAQAEKLFIWGINKALPMPFANPQPDKAGDMVNTGIEVDFARSASQRLGMKLQLQVVADEDMVTSLLNGKIHVTCYSQPSWLDNSDGVQWSESYGGVCACSSRHAHLLDLLGRLSLHHQL